VLVAAFARWPDRQRRVYVLRELHGLRIDETAAELGLTAAQVEQSLFAAPVAAKVGVVVAAATFAVGAPATVDRDTPHFQPALPSVPAHRAPARHRRTPTNIAPVAVEVARATAPVTREADHGRMRHGDGSGTSRRSTREPALEPAVTTSTPIVVTSSADTSHDGGGGNSGSGTSDGESGTKDGGGGSDGGSGGSSGPD
jgi:uncharacterized membrane protein YgcG